MLLDIFSQFFSMLLWPDPRARWVARPQGHPGNSLNSRFSFAPPLRQ